MKESLSVTVMILVVLSGLSSAADDLRTPAVTLGQDRMSVVDQQQLAKSTKESSTDLLKTADSLAPVKPRMYYLTENTFDGGDAIMACDLGFHMANMLEIQDPSKLQYANRRTAAFQSLIDGQRLGAPSNRMGWVRSGSSGAYDCGDWRGKYDTELGNTIGLYDFWYASESRQPVSGLNTWWQVSRQICSQQEPVWCIDDSENPQ